MCYPAMLVHVFFGGESFAWSYSCAGGEIARDMFEVVQVMFSGRDQYQV